MVRQLWEAEQHTEQLEREIRQEALAFCQGINERIE
jgi:hypothetical protein